MSAYNTLNPVPSTDPRDLDDNATNLDLLVNGAGLEYPDRLGQPRKSYAGMEAEVADFVSDPNLSAFAALVGLANTFAYFTGPGALALATLTPQARQLLDDTSFGAMLTTLNAAARGVNADITELQGLTTALSVLQGGTGQTTLGGLLTQLLSQGAYGKTNILGAVSQSGGVPTGAIFDTGSNAGGEWTRYADGRMECLKKNITFAGGTVANGSVFRSVVAAPGAMPQNFVGAILPSVFSTGFSVASGGGWSGCQVAWTLSNWGSWSVYTSAAVVGNLQLELLAKGKWFE